MMDAFLLRTRRAGLKSLFLPLIALALVAVLAAPSWAGTNILFDPTGGSGSNTNNTIVASGFTWAAGNAVSIGVAPTGVGPVVGQTFEQKYQALLGAVTGLSQTGNNAVTVAPQTSDATANSQSPKGGNITVGTTSTGNELTIAADFRAVINSVTPNPGSNSVTFNFGLVPGGTNVVNIYAQPAGTALNFAGTGFNTGTLIMSGHVIPSGFEGGFVSSFTLPLTGTGSPSTPVAFDQYSGDSAAQAFWANTKSTSGTGSAFVPVAVDTANSAYFPGTIPSLLQLSFNQVTTADPFNLVEPSQKFFGSTPGSTVTPTLGGTNGVSGPDIQFQAISGNDFAVPEPASIIQALAAVTMIPTFLYLRRRRASRQTVA